MPIHDHLFLAIATFLWAIPFPLVRSKNKDSSVRDTRARWGVALEAIGYSILWQGSFWTRTPARWELSLSVLLFVIACGLSWTGAFALGRHLRVDAALAANHELIRSGPYRVMRHPIYASMLCVLLGTGIVIAPWYLLLAGAAAFLVGTEIRMRTEDALLEARFEEKYRDYKRSVRGFIPFVR